MHGPVLSVRPTRLPRNYIIHIVWYTKILLLYSGSIWSVKTQIMLFKIEYNMEKPLVLWMKWYINPFWHGLFKSWPPWGGDPSLLNDSKWNILTWDNKWPKKRYFQNGQSYSAEPMFWKFWNDHFQNLKLLADLEIILSFLVSWDLAKKKICQSVVVARYQI